MSTLNQKIDFILEYQSINDSAISYQKIEMNIEEDSEESIVKSEITIPVGITYFYFYPSLINNDLNETVYFSKITTFAIKNKDTSPGNNLYFGGPASSDFFDFFVGFDALYVKSGGLVLLNNPLDGYDVTSYANKRIKIRNVSDHDIPIEVIIIGRT